MLVYVFRIYIITLYVNNFNNSPEYQYVYFVIMNGLPVNTEHYRDVVNQAS